MNRRSTFLRNSLTSYLPYSIDIVLRIIVIRLVLLRLGSESLGLWGILKAVVLFPLFLQSSLSVAIFLQTSRERSSPRLNEAFVVSLIFSLCIGVFLFALAPYLPVFFRVPASHLSMAISAFQISGISFVMMSLAGVFEEILRGSGRFDITNVVDTVTSLLNSAGSVLLLLLGFEILSLIEWDLITNTFILISMMIFCRRVTGWLPHLRAVTKNGFRALFDESFRQLVYATLTRLLWELDAIVIPRIFGIRQMASYWIGQRLAYAWKGLLWAGVWPVVPEAAEESPKTQDRLDQIHWLQVALLIPTATTLLYFANDIVRIWTSQQDALSAFVLRALTAAVFVDFFASTYISMFFAQGKVASLSRYLFAGVMFKIAIAWIAWSLLDFRLLIISTTAGAVVFSVLLIISICGKDTTRLRNLLKPAVAPCIASLVSIGLFSRFSPPEGWVGLTMYAISFLIISFLSTYFLMQFLFNKTFKDFSRLFSESH